MKRLVFALCLAAIAAAADEDRKDRVLRRLESVNPANVRLAWEDMARRWPDRFEANPKWLQTFERDRKRLMNAIMGDWGPYYGELPPVDGGEKFLADLRARLLQNPLLDCDRLLAIRRRQNALGLYQNWNQPRDVFAGCTNELGVLSNLRGKPTFKMLDATPANGYLGEVCLLWDATRAMYTRRTGRVDHPPKTGDKTRAVEAIHRVLELDLTQAGAKPREIELIPDADVNCYAGCYLPDGALIFLSDASMVDVPCVRGGSCWSRPKEATFGMDVTYRPWQRVHDVGFRILVEE